MNEYRVYDPLAPNHVEPRATVLVCPECGDEFTTRQRLGSHRYMKHKVPGSSPAAKDNRKPKRRRASTVNPDTEQFRDPETGELVCPSCGKRGFRNAGALGSHRARVHGHKSNSAFAKRRRIAKKRTRQPQPDMAETKSAVHGQPGQATNGKTPVSLEDRGIDVILEHLYPNGIPATRITEVVKWIDSTVALME